MEESEGRMWRWLGILVVMGLVLGCADVWKDTADFFDSGFADDDNDDDNDDGNDDDDDDDGGNQGDLTDDNLNGEWTLDLEDTDTTLDENLENAVSDNTLLGSWDEDTSDPEFLSPLITNFSPVTELVITTTSPRNFTFTDGDNTNFIFTWGDITGDRIRLTSTVDNTMFEEVEVQLEEDGTILTLTDDEGRTAVFNFQDGTEAVTSGSLQVDGDQQTFTTTITFRNTSTNTLTISEDYEIMDTNTLQLTEQGEAPVNVDATLSNDDDTLTLDFPPDDPRNRGTAVFTR